MSKDPVSELKQHVTYKENFDGSENAMVDLLKQVVSSRPGTIFVYPDETTDAYNVLVKSEQTGCITQAVLSYDENAEVYFYLDESRETANSLEGVQNGLRQFVNVSDLVTAIRIDHISAKSLAPELPDAPPSEESLGYVELEKKAPSFMARLQTIKGKLVGESTGVHQIFDKAVQLGEQLAIASKPKQLDEILHSLKKLEKDLEKLPANGSKEIALANAYGKVKVQAKINEVRNDCQKVMAMISKNTR